MTNPTVAPAPAPLSTAEDAQWAMLAHYLNIILVIPAMIIFLIFKDRGQRVAVESKEALNWSINVAGVIIILNVANVILGFIPVIGFIAWILITIAIWAVLITNLILAITGGTKVKNGGSYRYPLNHRWIK
ncbi:MAG: DUF4870 domain-containing protein [Leucobacter sp.]